MIADLSFRFFVLKADLFSIPSVKLVLVVEALQLGCFHRYRVGVWSWTLDKVHQGFNSL